MKNFIKKCKENIVGTGILVSLIFIPIIAFNGCNNSGYSEGDVIATAKHYVKQELKAPATAKFCSQNELRIVESSDGITVRGYVDSENGFGAMIRSYFTVILTSDGKYLKSIYIG